jgi:hypothetical protein
LALQIAIWPNGQRSHENLSEIVPFNEVVNAHLNAGTIVEQTDQKEVQLRRGFMCAQAKLQKNPN